jgi:enoyl-CoA hydratase
MQTHVIYQRDSDVAYLTFSCDEPGKPNTLDLQVLDELAARLEEIRSDLDALRAVIVRSDSPRYFLVGANINALQTLTPQTIIPWVQRGHAVFNALATLPLPVIARVEGYALGGGLELAMACDLIVASRDARLGQPEANLGLVSGWGGSYWLPQRVGLARAKELFFTGKAIDAEAAYAIGLVDFVGDSAGVEQHIIAMLGDIRSCGRLAVAYMKALIDHSSFVIIAENCQAEAVASSLCLASDDAQARIANYLESRRKGRKA